MTDINNQQQQLQNQIDNFDHNTSHSNNNTNYPTVNCIYHPSYFITNFCTDLRCLLPLCPQCVKVHIQEHKQKGTYGEIDTLDSIYDKTINQVKLCKQYHKQKQENIQILKGQKESIIDDLELKLAELKQQVFEKVEETFSVIRNDLQNKTQLLVKTQINSLQKLQEKNFEKEKFFEDYLQGMGSQQKCLKYLIKFYNDGIYNNNQNDVRSIEKQYDIIQNNEITLHINEDKIKQIFTSLQTQVVHMTSKTELAQQQQPTISTPKSIIIQDPVINTTSLQNTPKNTNTNILTNSNNQIIQLQQNQQYQQQNSPTTTIIKSHPRQIQQQQQPQKIIINKSPIKTTTRHISPPPFPQQRSPIQIKTPIQIQQLSPSSQIIQQQQQIQQSPSPMHTPRAQNNVIIQSRQQPNISNRSFSPKPLSTNKQQPLGIKTIQNNNNINTVQVPNGILKKSTNINNNNNTNINLNRSLSPNRQINSTTTFNNRHQSPMLASFSNMSQPTTQNNLNYNNPSSAKKKIFSSTPKNSLKNNTNKNISSSGNNNNQNKKPDLVTQFKQAFEQNFIFGDKENNNSS